MRKSRSVLMLRSSTTCSLYTGMTTSTEAVWASDRGLFDGSGFMSTSSVMLATGPRAKPPGGPLCVHKYLLPAWPQAEREQREGAQ